MRLLWLVALAALPLTVAAQEKAESVELVGQMGSRSTLLVLHATERPDGGWQVAGEYVILPTLARRFLEGERGPQLGVTVLKEGTSAILFGHPATAELRGTWHDGLFKGTRFGPGGQERERFEFSEALPSMAAYSASVHCEAASGAYQSTLAYAVDGGRLKPGSFEWRSSVGPSGHGCRVADLAQRPAKHGLRFAAGRCRVTLRDLGDYVKVAAENCSERCGSEAYLEPLLVDRGGRCRVLHPEPRQQ